MANASYDLIVIGTGPGGYETAIRGAQLGLKTAVIEKDKLGGVCLNVGCIPTKALLKSAEIMSSFSHAADFGIKLEGSASPLFDKVIERSRGAADKMSKGVAFLMKKNKIDVIQGRGKMAGKGKVDVEPSEDMDGNKIGEKRTVEAKHIIIATGARAREIPPLPIDHKKIIAYREALLQTERPASMLIAGAGAIGVEFAYFYHTMGTKVTLVEMMDRVVPIEDEDISKELARAFKKAGIDVMTSATVEKVDTSGKTCKVTVKTAKGSESLEVDQVLSAVGVTGNVENLGLDEIGVKYEKGAIKVDEFFRTNVEGVYAIGDVIGAPWLAHVASHEGIVCVEKIAGQNPEPVDYNNVPGCTYCQPQIASVGYTEAKAKEAGYDVKVGKFPFQASGKAAAIGHPEGFVKIIFDAKYGELLGAHIIGYDATEMIAEIVTARTLETTAHEIMESMHPHPTLTEAVMEAAKAAYGRAINI
ncbi:MAG: dihydrolipoyl dehydrogenase [Rhodothermales bacterium]